MTFSTVHELSVAASFLEHAQTPHASEALPLIVQKTCGKSPIITSALAIIRVSFGRSNEKQNNINRTSGASKERALTFWHIMQTVSAKISLAVVPGTRVLSAPQTGFLLQNR